MDDSALQLKQNDYLLEVLVGRCNRDNSTMTITFSSKGVIFSGTIISGRRFLQMIGDMYAAEILESDNEPEEADEVKTFFSKMADDLYGAKPEREQRITYVHFTDIVVLSPQITRFSFTKSFPYWRFKLSAIDGWTFGSVNPDELPILS